MPSISAGRTVITTISRRSVVTTCSSVASISLPTDLLSLHHHYFLNKHHQINQTTHCNHHRQQLHLFSTRTRRRRRGGASNNNSQDLSPQQFLSIANELLDKVESSVMKLQSSNEGIEITRHAPSFKSKHDDDDSEFRHHLGQLSIKVPSIEGPYEGGTYLLTINSDSNVALQCLSGNFTYIYNNVTCEWVGQEDGHSLLGMLTRDWIRQCHGVPDF